MDAASTSGGEVTSREMRVADRYAWVDSEVLGTASRYCGETEATLHASLLVMEASHDEDYQISPPSASDRVCHLGETNAGHLFMSAFMVHRLKIRLPFSAFQKSMLRHYRVAPSQLHPNAWGFIKAFEVLSVHLGITPTVGIFTYFFDVCPRKAGPKGWVSLRAHSGRPLLSLYVDSAKSSGVSFKRDFFKVVPKTGVLPFWRNSWDELEPSFSIYWNNHHYDWGLKTYSTSLDGLSEAERAAVFLLEEAIKERGGCRYSSRVLVDSLPDQLTAALEEEQMNLRDLMLKAKAIGVDGPRGKESRKRKIADGSASTHSGSQSLPPPLPTVEAEKVQELQSGDEDKKIEAERRKKKTKIPPKGDADRPEGDGGTSAGVPVLTGAEIFMMISHPIILLLFLNSFPRRFVASLLRVSLLQYLHKDVLPAAERAKEDYDKALKASTSAMEECAKLTSEKEALTVQLGTIGKEKKVLEKKLGEMEPLKKKVEDLGKELLAAEERRKDDLRKQKELHDAEVRELQRKLEAALEGERKQVADTLKYVEKAFDVAIEQVKVRNPAFNLDTRGMSYEYEVIDGAVVLVDGDNKIEVPPEGLPSPTDTQTGA
ncbi:hypothetical protein SESBI_22956 [Sesbania bispinosa]|nr:hypothetical protein SESBI_22956 [Sesbania bispinosa]